MKIVMKSTLYNQGGKEVGEIELADKVFGLKWSSNLVHQVVEALRANKRNTVAHAKGRGEVSGGGKKPWKQKGTGRARHGSIRSPIWIGGGVSHGPHKDKDYSQKINKSMKVKAICTVLSRKVKDGEVVFLDDLKFSSHKTKEAVDVFSSLQKIKGFEKLGEKGGKALVFFSAKDPSAIRAIRNLPFADAADIKSANILDILSYKFLVLSESSADAITSTLTK
jgi:large subunit ribosomal protein L4